MSELRLIARLSDRFGYANIEKHIPGRYSRVLVVEIFEKLYEGGKETTARVIDEWGQYKEVSVDDLIFQDLP